MAIIFEEDTGRVDPSKRFSRPFRVPAGLLSMVLSALAGVGIFFHLIRQNPDSLPVESLWLHLGWMVAFALMAGLGFCVIIGRKQAFWATMGFWLVITGGLIAQAFGGLLWGMNSILPADEPVWAVIILVGGIAAGIGIVALQVLATAGGSRNRFAAMVGVSVAAALTVVLVLNMIAFCYPFKKDFETLGKFGLSERTKRILEKVNQPIQLSVIYSDAKAPADTDAAREKRSLTQKYLQQVMELFEEMHQVNPNITVSDASGDVEKARLLERLRKRQHAATHTHEAMLAKIRTLMPKLEEQLAAEKDKWAKIPPESYLGLWNTGPAVQETLTGLISQTTRVNREVTQQLNARQLPDYVSLQQKLTGDLILIDKTFAAYSEFLTRLSEVPAKVKANSPKLLAAMDKCLLTVEGIGKLAGEPGSAVPEDSADVLKQLAVAVGQASTRARDVAYCLDTLAGGDKEDMQLIAICKVWEVEVQQRDGETTRSTRGRLLDEFARQMEALRAQIALQISDANAQSQQRTIKQIRVTAFQLNRLMKYHRQEIEKGIDRLQNVDKQTAEIFANLKTGTVFGKIQSEIQPILAQAAKLKAPSKDAMLPDVSGQNIIVIETGQKVDVLPFNEVWPPEMHGEFFLKDGEEPKRFFNGDSAIASRILSLTEDKPFGRILITYYRGSVSKGVNPQRFPSPPRPVPIEQLQVICKGLADANFIIDTWNLNDPMPASLSAASQPTDQPDEIPTVLLVIPPAVPLGQQHIEKVSRAIDSGATAIFLAKTFMPRKLGDEITVLPYHYKDYLAKNWGVDVCTNFIVVAGLPSDQPGKYLLDVNKLAYMPLNSFSDHPIGKPLRGRRLAWLQICPMVIEPKDKRPADVDVQDILTVSETMTNIWATEDIVGLEKDLLASGNLMSPHYDKGDMKVPLVVAAAATRSGLPDEDIKPSRIVVLGVSGGLDDVYLTSPQKFVSAGYRMSDPPRGNADLVVNSAYWLTGRQRFIAAGPLRIKPVDEMSRTTQNILWLACVIVLPLAVLAIGGVVLLIRRLS